MLNINHLKRQSLLAAAFSLLAIHAAPSFANDPVVLTFSTVGDSRQDNAAPDVTTVNPALIGVGSCPSTSGVTGLVTNPGLTGQDCKWQQNTKAWSRIIRTIQSQKANLLFFNGDMIMGYGKAGVPVTRNSTGTSETVITSPAVSDVVTSDLMQFYQQYSFWRGMVAPLMETGTYVVPVPGNHETQCKRCNKKSQVENENAWRDNMGDLVIDQIRLNNLLASAGTGLSLTSTNINTPPSSTFVSPANNIIAQGTLNPDGITTSQQQLSYSFDIGPNHFSIINTDPTGNDGHAPASWLDSDLTSAVNNGAQHLFVFGHKPAFYYSYTGAAPSSTSSLYLTNATSATNFWYVITKHNATYFSGHEHIYNVSQPSDNTHPEGGYPNGPYQVIVGAGGSPFDDLETVSGQSFPSGTLPTDRMYSWATVSIHQSGAVVMNTYGFDATMTNPVKTLGTFTLPAAK